MAVHHVTDRSLVEVIDVDVRDARVPRALAAGGGPAGDFQRLKPVRRRPFGNLLERERRKGPRQEGELHGCTSAPDVRGPSSDRYILHRIGAVDGGANRSRPRTKLREDNADLVDVGHVDALLQLPADRVEQEITGPRRPTADDDDVRRDEDYRVADPQAQVAPDECEPRAGTFVAVARSRYRLLNARPPTGGGDRRSAAKCLEAAIVPAAAQRTIRQDGLVPDLPGRAVVTKVHPAVDHHAAAHSGSERDADERPRPPSRAKAELGQRERSRVVDQHGRDADCRPDRIDDRHACPVARNVGQKAGPARRRIVETRNPDADRGHAADLRGGCSPELGKLVHHPAWPSVGVGGRLAGGHSTCPLRSRFDDDPLHVSPAQVEPEVTRRQRAVHPPSSVSTAPVVKRAPGPHKYTAAAATSSGLPKSPGGGCSSGRRARIFGSFCARWLIGVAVSPAAMTLQLIPRRAYVTAIARRSAMTPPCLAA